MINVELKGVWWNVISGGARLSKMVSKMRIWANIDRGFWYLLMSMRIWECEQNIDRRPDENVRIWANIDRGFWYLLITVSPLVTILDHYCPFFLVHQQLEDLQLKVKEHLNLLLVSKVSSLPCFQTIRYETITFQEHFKWPCSCSAQISRVGQWTMNYKLPWVALIML